jgi:hypothetical protein
MGSLFRRGGSTCLVFPRQLSAASGNTFKSAVHPDNLYPHANYSDRFKAPKSPDLGKVDKKSFSGLIPMDKVTVAYCLASGPGGMNVNKTETKVDIRQASSV